MFELGILEVHKDGNHGGSYPRKDEFVESGVPYLSAKCIDKNGDLDSKKFVFLSEEKAESLKIGHARKGDILFAHNATVGPVTSIEFEEKDIVIGTSLTCFRANAKFLNRKFLKLLLRSPLYQDQVKKVMKQSTRNQVAILKQREFVLPLPILAEQEKIADYIESRMGHINRIIREFTQSTKYPTNLRESVLNSAFLGNLVPQIEAEGSGHELLNEIIGKK